MENKKNKKILRSFLKYLKKKKIALLDKNIHRIFIKITYNFIWNIFLKAKFLSHHSKKKNLVENDLRVIYKDLKKELVQKKKQFIEPNYNDFKDNFHPQDFFLTKNRSFDFDNLFRNKYRDSFKINTN